MKFVLILPLLALGVLAKPQKYTLDMCSICTSAVMIVEEYADGGLNKLEGMIAQECNKTGEYFAPICCALIDALIPAIEQMLANNESPQQVCNQVKLCSSAPAMPIAAVGQPNEFGLFCSLCTSLVQAAENAAINNEAQLKQYIDNFCQKEFGKGFVGQLCVGAVNAIISPLLNGIIAKLPPQTVCLDCDLCSSSVVPKQKKIHAKKAAPKATTNPDCDLCKRVVNTGFGILQDPSLQSQVDTWCEEDSTSGQLCTSLVNDYLPELQLASNFMSAEEVCAGVLGMCDSAPASKQMAVAGTNQELCDVCMGAAQALVDELSDPSVQSAIQKGLLEVCNIMPSSEKDTCTMVIQNYFGAIWSEVMSYLNAKEICSLVKLCS